MRLDLRSFVRAAALATALSRSAGAQTSPDLDRSLQQLVADYTRLYTRDSLPRWRELFLPTFTSTSTTAEGGVSARSFPEFFAAQERAFASSTRMGERLENVRVDRRGRMATVWADFVFWYDNEERRGRLVLTAIHQREGWRFNSLMFSYHD